MLLEAPDINVETTEPARRNDTARAIQMRVESIRYGTHDTNIYELRPTTGEVLPPAQPGAHIAVHLPLNIVRKYSLLQDGAAPNSYIVGVKRDPRSRGGSSFIHEKLRVGDVVDIEPPRNKFPLREDAARTLLIAGGIGITPMISMWRRLKSLGREVTLVYACRSRRDALFLEVLENESSVVLRFDEDHGGAPLDMSALLAATSGDTHVYCCGPGPMLQAFQHCTSGWPADQVHLEYFASTQQQAADGGFSLKLARSGRMIPVVPGQTILAALQAGGVEASHSCEAGVCGACEVKVLAGIPDHRDSVLTDAEKAACNRIMVCCSGSKSPELVLDL